MNIYFGYYSIFTKILNNKSIKSGDDADSIESSEGEITKINYLLKVIKYLFLFLRHNATETERKV